MRMVDKLSKRAGPSWTVSQLPELLYFAPKPTRIKFFGISFSAKSSGDWVPGEAARIRAYNTNWAEMTKNNRFPLLIDLDYHSKIRMQRQVRSGSGSQNLFTKRFDDKESRRAWIQSVWRIKWNSKIAFHLWSKWEMLTEFVNRNFRHLRPNEWHLLVSREEAVHILLICGEIHSKNWCWKREVNSWIYRMFRVKCPEGELLAKHIPKCSLDRARRHAD
jgi:hypothetical protein